MTRCILSLQFLKLLFGSKSNSPWRLISAVKRKVPDASFLAVKATVLTPHFGSKSKRFWLLILTVMPKVLDFSFFEQFLTPYFGSDANRFRLLFLIVMAKVSVVWPCGELSHCLANYNYCYEIKQHSYNLKVGGLASLSRTVCPRFISRPLAGYPASSLPPSNRRNNPSNYAIIAFFFILSN